MPKISLFLATLLLVFAVNVNAQVASTTPLTEDERLVLIAQIQEQLASLIAQLIEALNNQIANDNVVVEDTAVEEEPVVPQAVIQTETKNYEISGRVIPVLTEDNEYDGTMRIQVSGYWPNDNVSFRLTDDQSGNDVSATSVEVKEDTCRNRPEQNISCSQLETYSVSTDTSATYTATFTVNGQTKETTVEWLDSSDEYPIGFEVFTWKSSRVVAN